MNGKSAATSHKQYISELAEPRRSEIVRIDKFIRKNIPKTWKPWMVAGMMGYGRYQYKTRAGKEGEWFRIGLASNKSYISMYICATQDCQYIAERYRKQLSKASIGRSCVRFKRFDDLDPAVVAAMLKEAGKAGFGM